MSARLFGFGILLGGVILSPASYASSLMCSHVFSNPVRQIRIDDLLGRSDQNSKLTQSFKLQLASLFQTIETSYGPLEFKAGHEGLNWGQLKTEMLRKAGQTKSAAEQYHLVADLMAHFNDAHVVVTIPSTRIDIIPVQLMAAGRELYVNTLLPNFPANLKRPPTPGDRVVEIDGVSPEAFRKRSRVWNSIGNETTSRSQFALSFGWWSEASGAPLHLLTSTPGQLRMKMQDHKTGEFYDVTLPIITRGEGLVERGAPGNAVTPPRPDSNPYRLPPVRLLDLPQVSAVLNRHHRLFRAEVPRESLPARAQDLIHPGATEPFFKLPADFVKIELPASPLKALIESPDLLAGTFSRNGQRVGFLRIPSYTPGDLSLAVRHLRYLISELQKTTDYLVIDQTNNPGGMVVYSDLIIKSLTGGYSEGSHMRFAVKPTQGFLRQYLEMRDLIARNSEGIIPADQLPAMLAKVDQEYRKIKRAFDRGENLSEPVSMTVIADYYEASLNFELTRQVPGMNGTLRDLLLHTLGIDFTQNQVYKKPVYMMINELDFSGGDATPAALKDYGRVRLVGTRTAGAGGTVEDFRFRGSHEFSVSLTTSLMVRKDGSLVENYGVKPDIEVPLQPQDIANKYENFFERTLRAIDQDRSR